MILQIMPLTSRHFILLLFACLIAGAPSPAGATDLQRGSRRILGVLDRIQRTARRTEYRHRTRINARRGIFLFDCSAMAGWVLRRATPRARRTVTGRQARRPLARDFYHVIARRKPGKRRGPWYRVPRMQDARPGDVIAWIRPRWFKSKNTGHVLFVLSRPRRNPGPVRGYLVRIADSTRLPHEDDSRRKKGKGGFGTGTMLFATDAAGRPTGYGWYGSISRPDWIIPTRIVIGRALR